jgi:Family of unknown function (DUF5681)
MTKQEKVGRGHPPVNRQFGRGQKRAAGRPKGALGEKAIVQKIAAELHKVERNGETVEVTTLELLLLTMRNLAMKGDLKAARWLTEYRERVLASDARGGFLVVPEVMPIHEFIRQQEFLNRFRTNPELKENPALASDRTTGD